MYVYGGFGGVKKTKDLTVQKKTFFLDDMWRYDMDSQLWQEIKPGSRDGKIPGKRRGHAAVLYKDTNTMYMFGGRRNFQPTPFLDYVYEQNLLVTNDLWGYDIKNNSWFVTQSVGWEIPHERQGMKMACWSDILYIFGGYYDPVEYLQDTWHYNISAAVWRKKQTDGIIPDKRFQYTLAMWNQEVVIFGGYGSTCTLEQTGTPGLYCKPDGPAYYYGDTWHYTQRICPNGCFRNGTCHYGSCICGPGAFGVDCSNFTCPDCTTMDPNAVNPDEREMPCEVWEAKSLGPDPNPVVLLANPPMKVRPADALPEQEFYVGQAKTQANHPTGAGIDVDLANSSIFDGNCYYNFGFQEKICRQCSLRGYCDYPTGSCKCDPMFSNFDCSYMACPHPSCNQGGACLLSGRCVCRYAVFENDCSVNFECPNECSYQGYCTPGNKGGPGACRCYDGFYGEDCSVEVAFSGAARLNVSLWQATAALVALVWSTVLL